MGRRLRRWLALDGRQRLQLAACVPGVWLLHAGLALCGYARTRGVVECLSQHPHPRPATPEDIAGARGLARLAATAGRYAIGDAGCLRRSLLLYGWLRRRGLRPCLQLGVAGRSGPFSAHAWVELEGQRLLDSDAGYRAFTAPG